MQLNAQGLAEAVVSHLDYELMCNRWRLVDEYAIYHPIWDYVASNHGVRISPQHSLKSLTGEANTPGRPLELDFAFLNSQQKAVGVIEVKYQKDIALGKDIFSDLFRLASIDATNLERWFLLAGKKTHIDGRPFAQAEGKVGDGSPMRPLFNGLLPDKAGSDTQTQIRDVQDHRTKLWDAAREKYPIAPPRSITIKLLGKYDSALAHGSSCRVWRIRKFNISKT